MSEIDQNRQIEPEKPLTLREYVGAFLPPKEIEDDVEVDAQRPLTLREYIGAMPNIYEIGEMLMDAGRAIHRTVRRTKDA